MNLTSDRGLSTQQSFLGPKRFSQRQSQPCLYCVVSTLGRMTLALTQTSTEQLKSQSSCYLVVAKLSSRAQVPLLTRLPYPSLCEREISAMITSSLMDRWCILGWNSRLAKLPSGSQELFTSGKVLTAACSHVPSQLLSLISFHGKWVGYW